MPIKIEFAMVVAAALVCACNASTAAKSASTDAGDAGISTYAGDAGDAGIGFNGQPCWQYVFCVEDGGLWNCDCNSPLKMVPACPAFTDLSVACSGEEAGIGGCYACQEGAGLGCICTDAGPTYDGGPSPSWRCIGTGNACR